VVSQSEAVCAQFHVLQVSPPDQHGFCSLGTSVDCVRAALMYSKTMVGKKEIFYILNAFVVML
jgi:acyl-CoA hydrolase